MQLRFDRGDLAPICVTEIGMTKARAQQIAAVHFDREQLASIEVAKWEIASQEARLVQLPEGESRAD
jgi:hypothetical protein